MKRKPIKLLSFFIISVMLLQANSVFALSILPGFNPNKLIEDYLFTKSGFEGPEGIQAFLESKNSVLANTSPDFLVKLKEPAITMLKEGLGDPQPNLPRLRTAAELLWDAHIQSGINPQVLLVTLQKEQGLITNHQESSPERLQRALNFAFGFNCPDSTGCSQNTLFPGFYYQLFGNYDTEGNRYLGAARSLMKSFNTNGGRGPSVNGKVAKVGETIDISNTTEPYGVPASQRVTLENLATAALYRFTPHVFNGNYNFWKYYTEWFKLENGTLLRVAGDNNLFIIQNGRRLLVPQFVVNNRQLNTGNILSLTANELNSYPAGSVYGPADNTVVQVSGSNQKYVFIQNVKYPASDFVLSKRGINTSAVLTMTQAESQMFQQGPNLTPPDGTVLKGQNDTGIYLVDDGKLKLYSAFVFKQHNAGSKIQVIPDDEMKTYPKSGFVAPLDGTLVKAESSPTVYLVEKGILKPYTGEIFKASGRSFRELVSLSNDEVNSFAVDGFAVPGDRTFFKVKETGQLYVYKEGAKHPISSYVAQQRGITPDFTFGQNEADSWSDGIAIAPKDGSAVKGDKDPTVYYVDSGQLRPVTYSAYQNRGLGSKLKVLPQAEVDGYAKGENLLY